MHSDLFLVTHESFIPDVCVCVCGRSGGVLCTVQCVCVCVHVSFVCVCVRVWTVSASQGHHGDKGDLTWVGEYNERCHSCSLLHSPAYANGILALTLECLPPLRDTQPSCLSARSLRLLFIHTASLGLELVSQCVRMLCMCVCVCVCAQCVLIMHWNDESSCVCHWQLYQKVCSPNWERLPVCVWYVCQV
jgi:hypothetical protein